MEYNKCMKYDKDMDYKEEELTAKKVVESAKVDIKKAVDYKYD